MTKKVIPQADAIFRHSSFPTPQPMLRIFIAGALVVSAVILPIQALAEKVVNLTCDNGARVQIRELYPVSTHRYVLGDLIEVRMWGERFEGQSYRVGAAPTASFGGRWVYLGNAEDGFSVLRSSKSEFWWIDREDLGKWTCVEVR